LHLRPDEKYDVKVSRLGFKTSSQTMWPTKNGWNFTLQPEPLHINVFTPEASGKVLLDGQKIADLEQGGLTDFELASDGGRHLLSAAGKTGELFRVAFQSTAGRRTTVEPLTTKDLIVTSSLGKQATVWSGSLPKAAAAEGKSAQDIPRDGLNLDLNSDQDRLTISDAKRRQVVAIAQGNAPFLNVSLEASPNLGSITITTTAKDAALFVDGKQKTTRKAGSWYFQTVPGAHSVKLVADGMQDAEFSISVAKGENIVRPVEMQAGLATLAVEGGTAGAQVLVDGQEIGILDDSGNLIHAGFSAGLHAIEFRKEGFDSLTTRQPFNAGQRISLRGDYLKLKEALPGVSISVTPRSAKVAQRRAGETEWHAAQTYTSLRMPAGTYEFRAEADGYTTLTKTFALSSGKANEVNLVLARPEATVTPPPSARSYFEGPVFAVGSWFTGKTSAFVRVRAGLTKFNLIFLRPDHTPSGTRKPKHLEWTVSLDSDNHVSYSLDGRQLTRKLRLGSEESKLAEKVNADDGESAYSLLLSLESHHVQIKSKDGTLLDEFLDGRHDWSQARAALKGDALFLVRPTP
jgi:hypothetical protein